jgi:hypothetical protein
LIFVWPGSAAQIGAGFLITLGSLLMALIVRPFQDKELGFMHSFSLVVQAITLYAGIMLLTQRSVLATSKAHVLWSVAWHPASLSGLDSGLADFCVHG